MTLRGAFIPNHNIALFLDVDGTLLEIAPTPSAVKVPAALRNTLHLAHAREHGALALISGRSIEELDRLFAPHKFPAAGHHGLERRTALGSFVRPTIDNAALNPARATLLELQERQPGLLLEDKGATLAMHFRRVPKLEMRVHDVMANLVRSLADRYELRPGRCVLEIVPRGISKRGAIEAFMAEPPF